MDLSEIKSLYDSHFVNAVVNWKQSSVTQFHLPVLRETLPSDNSVKKTRRDEISMTCRPRLIMQIVSYLIGQCILCLFMSLNRP